MDSTAAIIVGDIYQDLCVSPHIISVSALKQNMAAFSSQRSQRKFIAGQGIDRRVDMGLVRFFVDDFPAISDVADTAQTHKQKCCNNLITIPQAAGNDDYVSELVIDANSADISDHNTGFHLQGMVLIEAARQMILAVMEAHLFDVVKRGSYFVVLDHLSASFSAFAFPLPARLRCHVDHHSVDTRGNVTCRFAVGIWQADQEVANVQLAVRNYSKEFMRRLETTQARATIQKILADAGPRQPVSSDSLESAIA